MSDFSGARSIELETIDPSSEFVDQLVFKLSSYLPSFGIDIDEDRLRLCVVSPLESPAPRDFSSTASL